MNYYEHHLGDYAKDTGHLSMLEHGAYRLLLDRYYSTEEGIPAAQAYRLARARSEEECHAVDVVLDEFFDLVDGVWVNRRAEEEIEKARVRIGAAKENGKKGGRPRKPAETQQKPSGFSVGSISETQQKAHQAPSTKHQTPEKVDIASGGETSPARTREEPPLAAPPDPHRDPIHVRALELTALLIPRGCRLNASNPYVRSWAERAVSDAQMLTAFDIAEGRRAEKGDASAVNAGYLNAIVSDLLAQPTVTPLARASPVAKSEQLREHNRASFAAAKAAILAREQQHAVE